MPARKHHRRHNRSNNTTPTLRAAEKVEVDSLELRLHGAPLPDKNKLAQPISPGAVEAKMFLEKARLAFEAKQQEKEMTGIAAAQQEPFGYFKAEPFGWTDCAETDEGAVALYQHPPAQRTWQDLPDMEIIECAVHARFEYDPPYVDKNGVKHLAAYEIQLGPTYKAIAEKLKQKNGYTEVGYGIKENT